MRYLPAPSSPPPPDAEVHVWRLPVDAIPRDEALRHVLPRYLSRSVELVRDEHGKPRLAVEPERLSFNLSHSGDLALVAVSRGREIGVDVEREKPGRDLIALAERALAPEEAAAVRESPEEERARTFYKAWTRHEARLKCLGVGIGRHPTWPSPAVAVIDLPINPGYSAAVAVTGEPVPIRCWTLA